MQLISHDLLVHMLKYRIHKSGLTLRGLAQKSRASEEEIQAVLDKRAFATPRLLARLAHGLGLDWRAVALGYAAWRYDTELARQLVASKPTPKPATLFRMLEVANQIIADHPMMDAEALAHIIHTDLQLDKGAIRNQIAHARGQQSGDYHHG